MKEHAIICGFGVPGRAVAEWFDQRNIPYAVIEANAVTCDRAGKPNRAMIEGDARDPAVLETAGIASAILLVVAIPQEAAALKVVEQARLMNGTIPIIARTHFISAGMEARRLGATVSIIEEQIVGQEFVRVLNERDKPLQ